MKRKDITALHGMTVAELNKKLIDLTAQIAKARLEKKVGRLANTKQVSTLAKDIARIKTIMTEKEITQEVKV